jgi:endoglucanase
VRTNTGRFGGRRALAAAAAVGLVWALAPASATASVARAAKPVVRVNQVGYPTSAPKRAYLMTPAPAQGSTFFVVDHHQRTVYRASVGADQGVWSNAYPFVYALDFDAVVRAGTYRIAVNGPFVALSLQFRIGDAADLYSTPLANALSYYRNSRDGAHFIPSVLRTAPGHLNDAVANTYLTPKVDGNGNFVGDLTGLGTTIDASGGWWDAGDYLKFVETTSYVVAVLGVGVRDFTAQMGTGAGKSDFNAEVRFGTDFIQKMWDDSSRTLYYQVGIGSGNTAGTILSDHDIWRLPQADDSYQGNKPKFKYIRNRPAFRAAPAGSPISPNLAGRLAADMGLCYQLFKKSAPAYANKCLLSGEHIFGMADTSPGQLLTAIPFGFYGEKEWRDDLELGATELAKAIAVGDLPAGLPHGDAGYYLKQAAHWANAYITGPNDAKDTLNLYDDSGLAHFELYRAIAAAGTPAGLEVSQARLLADIKKQLDGAVARATADPYGFGFPWDTFDTTTHGAGMAVMASEYDQLTGSQSYRAFGARQLGNILGANAWGVSLIVGDGQAFPDCMQHQVTNLIGSHNGSPPILAGAAVEGPNNFAAKGTVPNMRPCLAHGQDTYAQYNGFTAIFRDDVQSYSTVEPAIDLTASSPLAFAWQIAG